MVLHADYTEENTIPLQHKKASSGDAYSTTTIC